MSQNLSSNDSSIPLPPTKSTTTYIDGATGFNTGPVFNYFSDQSVGGKLASNDSSGFTRHSKSSKKSQERTLEIFQRLNTPQTVVEKLQSAKYERFFGTHNDHVRTKEARREELRKFYAHKSFLKQNYLNLLGVPSPFPYVYKPSPPPYPLPAVEGSILTVERPSVADPKLADAIPKVNSLYENPTKLRRYDAKKLDYERKHMPFLDRKGATTSIDVMKTARIKIEFDRKIEQESKPVAQQAREWGFRLRNYSQPHVSAQTIANRTSTQNATRRTATRKLLLDKTKSKLIMKTLSSTEDDFTFTEPTRKSFKFNSDFPSDYRSHGQSGPADLHEIGRNVEITESTSTGGLFGSKRVEYVMPPPHFLPQNRTARRAEKKMKLIQHKLADNDTTEENKHFGQFVPRTKFFIHRGKPVPTKAFLLRGNTFNLPNPDVKEYNPSGNETKPVRKFVLHLEGFENNELSFFIEGNVISVIGEQDNGGTRRQGRRIVESVRLPDDLDLNRIIISRDYTGKVLIEELHECYDYDECI